MSTQRIIAATEIGTSKTVVLVALVRREQPPRIIGYGEAKTAGVLKGGIVTPDAVTIGLHSAFAAAEKMAGVKLASSYLAIAGEGLCGDRCSGEVELGAGGRAVSEKDLKHAKTLAMKTKFADGWSTFMRRPHPVFLDGKLTTDPVGRRARKLMTSYWAVAAQNELIAASTQALVSLSRKPAGFLVSSDASGSVLTNAETRENGVLVVDIGAGTTDYVLYRFGCVIATGSLPIGGDHITTDLCAGLGVPRARAEEIKRAYDPAALRKNTNAMIVLNPSADSGRKVRVAGIDQIIRARLTETFSFIKNRLGPKLVNNGNLASGVVLTGGTSRLAGVGQIAALTLGLDHSGLGEFVEWVPVELLHSEYATVLGVLADGAEQCQKHLSPGRARRGLSAWLHRFFSE